MALGLLLLLLVALVALSLAPLAAAPTFTHLVMLPQTEKGLSSFLDIPFHTINRGMAASRMGFLDVTSSDDVRNWIYQQMVAMNVVVGAKNGIDMVYVGFEDGRFIGYFSIEGVKQYTFRPAGDAPPSDLSWAPHANAAAVNGAATCTGTQTSDSADCALATAWTSGDQSEGTCATADGCSFWAVQGVSGSDVSESCPTPTCTGTQTSDGADCALATAWTSGDQSEGTCATADGCSLAYPMDGESLPCVTQASGTKCCSTNIRNYYDTTRASKGAMGDFKRWRLYDPRVRPWYTDQKGFYESGTQTTNGESSGWSNLYTFFTTKQLGISAMGALMLPNGGGFGGVWAIDFPLYEIANLLNTTIMGRQRGYACWMFIVERSGTDEGKLIGSVDRAASGATLQEPMVDPNGVRPFAIDSLLPGVAHTAARLSAAGWPVAEKMTTTMGAVNYEVSSSIFRQRNIEWLLVGGQDTACPVTAVWLSEQGVCSQCLPGTHPVNNLCVECAAKTAGSDGTCKTCPAAKMPNILRTLCERCPPNHVPSATGDGCMSCPSGMQPNSAGTHCECMKDRYDRSFGLIFCFELGWQEDPVRGRSAAFPSNSSVELSAGNRCLPCPVCVECNGNGTAPVPTVGWGLSPTAKEVWEDSLDTNTTEYAVDPRKLVAAILGSNPSETDLSEAEEFRSLHAEHVEGNAEQYGSSFDEYVKDCEGRKPASVSYCSETFSGEGELNGYCDFDPLTVKCTPALHRYSLNRSLFKCEVSLGQSACNATARATSTPPTTTRRALAEYTNGSKCAPFHTGTLCGKCEKMESFWLPDVHGGMGKACRPCVAGGAKFVLTLIVMAVVLLGFVKLFKYLEKKSASLDELRMHYTILSKVHQAASTLRGGTSGDDGGGSNLRDTVRVIIGNFQIISSLPVVFEAKFVKHIVFSKWIFDLRKYFQLDFFGLMSVDCIIRVSLYVKFVVIIGMPILLILFIQLKVRVKWFTMKRRLRKQKAKDDEGPVLRIRLDSLVAARKVAVGIKAMSQTAKINKAAAMTFAVIFFFYPIVSSTIFQMLDCRPMDFGQEWHTYDLAIDCHGTLYKYVWMASCALIVAFPIGIPVFFYYILYMNRSRLSEDTSGDLSYDVFEKLCLSLHPHVDSETMEKMFEDVDTDGSGGISQQEMYSYAFFAELQRRVATMRQVKARDSRRHLSAHIKDIVVYGKLRKDEEAKDEDNAKRLVVAGDVCYHCRGEGHWRADCPYADLTVDEAEEAWLEANPVKVNKFRSTARSVAFITGANVVGLTTPTTSSEDTGKPVKMNRLNRTRTLTSAEHAKVVALAAQNEAAAGLARENSKALANSLIEHQHDEARTIYIGSIPANHAQSDVSLHHIFSEFGKIASLTVRRRPFRGKHRNWALISFFNVHAVENAFAAADSPQGIHVLDDHQVHCALAVKNFTMDHVFKSDGGAKALWEEQRAAMNRKVKRPWWYGDKDDFSFLVKLYRPSCYWFEIVVFCKKLVLAGVIVFVDPGSITQLYVALAVSFLFFGILEHCRPYKSAATQRVARLAEINLFGTLSFVLMMEIDLDGEVLGIWFYDMALVLMSLATSSIPIFMAMAVALRRIWRLWADSDPLVAKGDRVEVIDPGPENELCINCVGMVTEEVSKNCTYETFITVEVTPNVSTEHADEEHDIPASVQFRRWLWKLFGCGCVKGQLQIGAVGVRVVEPITLELKRNQIRKKVKVKKVMMEVCKLAVHALRLARSMSDEDQTSELDKASKKAGAMNKNSDIEGFAGAPSNAAFAGALVKQLRPVLEPMLNSKGLLWDPVLPYLKKSFNVDELQKALEDPQKFIEMLLENPLIRRMILEGLRKVLEPLVIASSLTWLIFRAAFDLLTERSQIEMALDDAHAFFEYMLKKGGLVCKALIVLLQPKIEHLVIENSMKWAVVCAALEGFATVEMLLIAMEAPESWFEGILPKLSGAQETPPEPEPEPEINGFDWVPDGWDIHYPSAAEPEPEPEPELEPEPLLPAVRSPMVERHGGAALLPTPPPHASPVDRGGGRTAH